MMWRGVLMRPIAHKPTKPQSAKYTVGNLALLPASLLPFRDECRRLAATLPTGEILMVVPPESGRLRGVLRVLSPALRDRGRHITTISTDRIIRTTYHTSYACHASS